MPSNSGMNVPHYNEIDKKNNEILSNEQQKYPSNSHSHTYPYQQPYPQVNQLNYNKPYNNYMNENQIYKNNDYYEPYENTKSPPNCVDVADHVKNCSVCSRLYHTDKTIYFIIIAILSIICIILLKKVIDV